MNKTFRTAKARQLTKRNPVTGNAYIFARDIDVIAVKNGQFYPEDESWMTWMTTEAGGNLLVWTNMPDDVVEIIESENDKAVRLSDLPSFSRKDAVPDFHLGKSQEQIDIEVALNRYWDEVEAMNNPIPERELSDAEKIALLVSDLESLREENADFADRILELENELKDRDILIAEMSEKLAYKVESSEDIVEEDAPIEETDALESVEEEEKVDSEALSTFKASLANIGANSDFVKAMKQEFSVSDLSEVAEEMGMEYEGTKAEMITKMMEKLSN